MGWTVKENVGEAKEVAGEKAKENVKILKELDKPLNAKDLKKIGSVNDISKNQLTELDKPLNAKDLKKIGSANDVPKNQLSALDRPLNTKNDIKRCEDRKTEENINESDNASEAKELTKDEINKKQKDAIADALERILNGEKFTNEQLGNLGEMMMDQYYISKGYEPLNKQRVTSIDDKKSGFKNGIDGVYEKTNPDGSKSYVIADAKYNTSQLSETNDGKQMSDNWIDKRLDDAVGKEKADEIRDACEDNPDSVSHEVYHINPNVDENGNMHTDIQKIDSEGNKVGDKTIVEYFDKDGNRIEPSIEY